VENVTVNDEVMAPGRSRTGEHLANCQARGLRRWPVRGDAGLADKHAALLFTTAGIIDLRAAGYCCPADHAVRNGLAHVGRNPHDEAGEDVVYG
jgi:hypothetical protein